MQDLLRDDQFSLVYPDWQSNPQPFGYERMLQADDLHQSGLLSAFNPFLLYIDLAFTLRSQLKSIFFFLKHSKKYILSESFA